MPVIGLVQPSLAPYANFIYLYCYLSRKLLQTFYDVQVSWNKLNAWLEQGEWLTWCWTWHDHVSIDKFCKNMKNILIVDWIFSWRLWCLKSWETTSGVSCNSSKKTLRILAFFLFDTSKVITNAWFSMKN